MSKALGSIPSNVFPHPQKSPSLEVIVRCADTETNKYVNNKNINIVWQMAMGALGKK
jgi:hypothetical protein